MIEPIETAEERAKVAKRVQALCDMAIGAKYPLLDCFSYFACRIWCTLKNSNRVTHEEAMIAWMFVATELGVASKQAFFTCTSTATSLTVPSSQLSATTPHVFGKKKSHVSA